MRIERWFQNAIIYCLDVESFQDSDGDGVGDFTGLHHRLCYLERLGVTCVWLLPFYPSPNRDNGYDVTDYYGVSARLGTLGDFVAFTRAAQDRGIRVMIDLVINHTSDQHPWFQAARRGHPRYRDYYVWRADDPGDTSDQATFPGVQHGIWTYDEEAREWYLHNFFEHQPDLNLENPDVRREICKIMAFWTQLGVSGFRLDAAPFLIGQQGSEIPKQGLCFDWLQQLHESLTWHRGDAILLAEANVLPEHMADYFGDGNRLQMMLNFWVNQHLWLSLARKDARPLARAMRQIPAVPSHSRWAMFLRNHDELDLGRLSTEERAETFRAFGPEPSMQIYERGLRRRLAPMLDGDSRRVLLAYSLLLSYPGVPVLWYGDEIGMGEDLALFQRDSVHTPMQWSSESNAGFSNAPPEKLLKPVVSEGPFAYDKVNVECSRRDPESLLNGIERMIRQRKECPELADGNWRELSNGGHPAVLAHAAEGELGTLIAVHNLGAESIQMRLDPPENHSQTAVDLFTKEEVHLGGEPLHLEPYGFRWLRVQTV